MQQRLQVLLFLFAFAAIIAAPATARATDKFEIQVYQGEHNAPGQVSCELHTNFTFAGQRAPAYDGETPAHQVLRLTLEPALGITDWLEVGAYLQGMGSGPSGGQFAGWKLRAKIVAPERLHLPVILGINVEVGRVPLAVEQDGWANEFRPILGVRLWPIHATVNPLFGFAMTGSGAFKPDFEPAGKVKVDTRLGFAVGTEYYASLGRFDTGFSPFSQQEHLLFGVLDLESPEEGDEEKEGEWEVNLGFGVALSQTTPQHAIGKMIVGRSF